MADTETISPPSWKRAKKAHSCVGCPFQRSQCMLSGLYNPNATLTIVAEAPAPDTMSARLPFQDREAAVIREIIRKVRVQHGLPVQYNAAYVVGAAHQRAPKKAIVTQCFPYLEEKLGEHRKYYDHFKPDCDNMHVIVTLGKTATQAFLPRMGSLKSARGKAIEITVGDRDFIIIPTYGPLQLLYTPGLSRTIKRDIHKAWRLSRQSSLDARAPLEELTAEYVYPKTLEEVEAVCTEILSYTDPDKRPDPDDWPIAVDIETNTLHPYQPDARVNVVSIAWDDGLATSILLDHPDVAYDTAQAWPHVAKVLASNKPKVFHNGRFDIQFLEHRLGHKVNNLWWDTMLAEHFLDEDKKGEYSLKVLAGHYTEEYAGYENILQQAFFDDELERRRADLPEGQTAPDCEQSWALMAFFPGLDYKPSFLQVDEDEDLELKKELFNLDKDYLNAHVNNYSKGKTSARGKINRRCDKHDLERPDTVDDLDFQRVGDNGFEHIPTPVLLRYAAVDADITRQIVRSQRQRMVLADVEEQTVFRDGKRTMTELYVPGTMALSRMEYKGTRMNIELIETYREEAAVLEDKALAALRQLICQPEFNPNSTNDLAQVVEYALDIPRGDLQYTDEGSISVTKDWYNAMATKFEGSYTGEFMYYLQVFKAAAKTRSSFLKKFVEMAKLDGRIHTRFNLNGTATGRLSSAGPNLQNVPLYMCRFQPPPGIELGHSGMNIKAAFVPSTDDKVFFQLDIAAAEIRVLCAYARDPKLIKALREGLDVHSFVTSEIFDISYDEVYANKDIDPEMKLKRTATKRVVFGMIYGAGPYKIAEQIYGALAPEDSDEFHKQVGFAKEVMSLLFDRFSGIQKYIDETHRTVDSRGFVTTYFGRYRRFPLKDTSWKLARRAERMAVNFKIQSTASDIVLSQLCEVEEHIHEIGGDLLLTVHDSVAGEIDRDRVPEMRAFFDHYIVERVKERFPWLPVPFKYDLEVGPSYGELVAYEVLEKGPDAVPDGMRPKIDDYMSRAGLTYF